MHNSLMVKNMGGQSLRSTATVLFCIVLITVAGRKQCHAGWVDPDTPEEFLSTTSNYAEDTREYELVRNDVSSCPDDSS